MKNFARAMVGLDLSEMDEMIIKKVGLLSGILGIEKVYFIHVSKNLTLPKDILEAYPDLLAPTDEAIKSEIESLLKSNNFPSQVETEVIVDEGKPLESVLVWAKRKDVDLIIMGRKKVLEGSGSLAKNTAQKAPCSVLFLTEEGLSEKPKNLLLAMDFSEYSHLCLEFAEKIASEQGAKITGINIYEVPIGYYKTGKTFEEFAQIMESHARTDMEKFLRKYHHPAFDCVFKLRNKKNIIDLTLEESKNRHSDLLIVGSRGRTASAAILLGSTAEKLVHANNEIPMLILKQKGENMTAFEALSKI